MLSSEAFVEEIKSSIHDVDVAKFIALCSPNATMRLGNFPPAHGHAEITKNCEPFYTHLSKVNFTDSSVEDTPTSIIWQSMASFHRKDGFVLTVPYCVILHREGDLIKDYIGYLDITGLIPTESLNA